MKLSRTWFALLITSLLTLTVQGHPLPTDILDVGRDGSVDVQINGFPAKMEVRGDGISYPVLNPDVAETCKLRANIFGNVFGIEAKVGSIAISGHTAKAKLSIMGRTDTHRVLWFDRAIVQDLAGSIGPNAIPQSLVRLNVSAAIAQPKVTSLPLQIEDGRVGTTIRLDQTSVFVMFNPLSPRTIASAGAGQVIATTQTGKWTGAQESIAVNFGIERPVRELALSNPIRLGDLVISSLLVRDNSRVTGVSEANTATGSVDSNEVTLPAVNVTAETKGPKPSYQLTLGRDVLDQCTSITFNKLSGHIDLNCDQEKP